MANQIDIANVDAEFERSGRDKRLELAMLETMLGVAPLFLGHAAVVRGNLIGTQALGQGSGCSLGHAARVHKNQSGVMIVDQPGEPVMDQLADFARHHGFERRGRKLDGEVARPAMADVDNLAGGTCEAMRFNPCQKMRHGLERLLGCRQADPSQAIAAKRRQAFERQREMGAALVWRQGVDLVDDHGPRRCQHGTAGLRRQQDVKRFRRGDEDMRRPPAHLCAFALRRIAGAYPGADFDARQTAGVQGLADPGKRRFQIFLDVVRQRLEGRDIDDLGGVLEPALEPLPHEAVDRGEEGGERLARSGRRRDQDVLAGPDRRPRLRLRRGRRRELTLEPSGNRRMQNGRGVHEKKSIWLMERQNSGCGFRAKGRRAAAWRLRESRGLQSPRRYPSSSG